jgi:hypothetical protein
MGFEAGGGTAVPRVQSCEGTPRVWNDDSCEPVVGILRASFWNDLCRRGTNYAPPDRHAPGSEISSVN